LAGKGADNITVGLRRKGSRVFTMEDMTGNFSPSLPLYGCFTTQALGPFYLMDLLSLRLVMTVGAKYDASSSASQWAFRMLRTFNRDPSVLAIELSHWTLLFNSIILCSLFNMKLNRNTFERFSDMPIYV